MTDALPVDEPPGVSGSTPTTPLRSISLVNPQKCIGQMKALLLLLEHGTGLWPLAETLIARSQPPLSSAMPTFGHTCALLSGGGPEYTYSSGRNSCVEGTR